MNYEKAHEIKKTVDILIDRLSLSHIKKTGIHCIRSFDAKTRDIVRIWGMSRLFTEVAGIFSHRERYHRINDREVEKILKSME